MFGSCWDQFGTILGSCWDYFNASRIPPGQIVSLLFWCIWNCFIIYFSLLTRSYCFFVFVCICFVFVGMCFVVYTVSWMFGTFGLCVLSWLLFLLEGYGSLLFWLFELVCGIVCIVLSICVALDLGLDCLDGLVLNVWICF